MKKETVTTNQITEGVIWKQLLLFFFPIVLGTFFQQLYNTADTIVVGRFVSKEALAAVGGSAAQIVIPAEMTSATAVPVKVSILLLIGYYKPDFLEFIWQAFFKRAGLADYNAGASISAD